MERFTTLKGKARIMTKKATATATEVPAIVYTDAGNKIDHEIFSWSGRLVWIRWVSGALKIRVNVSTGPNPFNLDVFASFGTDAFKCMTDALEASEWIVGGDKGSEFKARNGAIITCSGIGVLSLAWDIERFPDSIIPKTVVIDGAWAYGGAGAGGPASERPVRTRMDRGSADATPTRRSRNDSAVAAAVSKSTTRLVTDTVGLAAF